MKPASLGQGSVVISAATVVALLAVNWALAMEVAVATFGTFWDGC